MLLIIGHWLPAQSYQAQVLQQTYTPLKEGIVLNQNPWSEWQRYPDVPIGFDFVYFNDTFSHFTLEISSRMVFDNEHHHYFDPLVMVHLADPGNTETEIRYHTNGPIGQRVFTLEYHNVRIKSDTSLFVHFQAKLYEKSGQLEMHMGPHSDVKPKDHLRLGPYAGVYTLKSVNPVSFKEGLNLQGNGASPTSTFFTGSQAPYLQYTLNRLPPEGTVYQYAKQTASRTETAAKQRLRWHPSEQVLYSTQPQVQMVEVYNLNGKVCFSAALPAFGRVSLEHLPKGLYLLHTVYQTQKIVIL